MTPTQRKNLLKLARYLESLPPRYEHFDMLKFAAHRGACNLPMEVNRFAALRPNDFIQNCGTVACAVGHGPAAGIRAKRSEFLVDGLSCFVWGRYCERVFGISNDFDRRFDYLFSSEWEDIDNSHYGAAARIRRFLATDEAPRPSSFAADQSKFYRRGSKSKIRRAIDAAERKRVAA